MLVYLIVIPIALLTVLFLKWYNERSMKKALLDKLPGEKGTFLMGNASWILKIISKTAKYHPGVYILETLMGYLHLYPQIGVQSFWIGPHHAYVSVYKPEALELIMGSSSNLEKSADYKFLHKWLGQGLLTSYGPKWRSRRKLLTPCFHFRILEDFIPTFNEQSLILVKKLKTLLDKEYVDLLPLILLCTLDVICETMMGVRIGAQEGDHCDYVAAIDNIANQYYDRFAQPWLWNDYIFYNLSPKGRSVRRDIQTVHSFTNKVIKDKKAEMLNRRLKLNEGEKNEDQESKKRRAFLDLLLDLHISGEHLTEQDIREEVDTFMFEGHDTTAVAITYALYCIGLYPEVQRKIMEELNSIFNDDLERSITLEDVRRMKYLECVIKEALRLYPSVPMIARKLDKDIHYEGCTILKGITVFCYIIGVHRRSDIYPEPEIFDPDRFLPENVLKRHPYAYIPFAAGSRNCIGQKFALMEEKVVISNILRHFQLISLDPRDQVKVKMELTLKPDTPIRMKFLPRKSPEALPRY